MATILDPLLAETLRALPLFGHLPEESDACFAALRKGQLQDFAPGDVVLARGDLDHAVFLVEGVVRSGQSGPVSSVPGSYFGVLELIAHQPANDSLSALTSVRAFVLQQPAMGDLLQSCRGLVMRLLSDCATQLTVKDLRHD